jgi:hypothetical protein
MGFNAEKNFRGRPDLVSSELSLSILGALIFQPKLIDLVDLSIQDFPIGMDRETFAVITSLWENSRPSEIDPLLLCEKIGGNGAKAFIGELMDGRLRLEPEIFRNRVSELKKKRLTAQILAKIERQAKSGELDLEDVRGDLAEYDQLRDNRGGVDIREQLMSGAALQVLEIESEFTVEKVVPSRSITLLSSMGGGGKTFFGLGLANAVSRGEPFLGLMTKRRPVCYIDFENPLPLLVDRIRKLNIQDVMFWHLSANVPPPKLDTAAYILYRQLPPGILIFDTLRAAHGGDENSSQDMSLVMGRLKELRELGFDIFLDHHTPKSNERTYKGSTAISDLADHVLKLYRTRNRGSLEEVQDDGEPDPDSTFVLATGKTRFEPFHMFLTFNPGAGGFSVAEDPNLEALETLAGYIAGPGRGQNQSAIIEWAKTEGIGPSMRSSFLSLLNRGEREGRWRSQRGSRGAKIYEPT